MNNNGELIVPKCPSCGAIVDLDEHQDFGFCKYCGSKVVKKESIVQKIEVTNPIQIQGGVKIINNEFEAKLAQVDHEAQRFLEYPYPSAGSISVTDRAKEVIDSYKKLESVGANEAKLWDHYLDYYIKINMIKKLDLVGCKEFEITVKDLYNQILKYEQDEMSKKKIEEKYNIQKIINQYKEKRNKYSKKCS